MPPQQISPSANEEFAVVLGDLAGLAEGLGDLLGVADRVLVPGVDAGGGIDADAAGRADAELAHLLADLAGLLHLLEEALALVGRAHGRTAAGAAPDRRHERADLQAIAGDVIGDALHVVLRAVDRDMRIGEPEIDAVELHAVDLGVGGQLQQRIERDDRLRPRRALADHARPRRVVQLRIVVGVLSHAIVLPPNRRAKAPERTSPGGSAGFAAGQMIVAQQILGTQNMMLLSRRHGASFLPPVSHFCRLL